MFGFGKSDFDKERESYEKYIRDFEESTSLDNKFIFYIGDLFHNFGNNCWFKKEENKEFCLTQEDQAEIAYFFQNMRLYSNRMKRPKDIKSIIREYLSISVPFSKDIFSSKLKEDFQIIDKYNLTFLELKELFYRLIILKGKHVMSIATSNNYSFEGIEEINSIKELFKDNYNVNIKKSENFWEKFDS